MEVVAGITDPALAERILRHVGLLDRPRAPPVTEEASRKRRTLPSQTTDPG